MTRLKIKVTKDILRKSMYCGVTEETRFMPTNCGVALAIRDIFPQAAVVGDFFRPFGCDNPNIVWLPKCACRFIEIFDNTDPDQRHLLDEIEFEVEIPDEVINQINIDELRPLLENHPTLQLV